MTAQALLEGFPGGPVYYDRRIRNFRFTETDEPVPRNFLGNSVRNEQSQLSRRFELNTRLLLGGQITLANWEANISAEIRNSGLAVVVAAGGGIENITTSPGTLAYWRMFGINLQDTLNRVSRVGDRLAMGDLTEAQLADRLNRISLELFPMLSRAEVITGIVEGGFNEARRLLDGSVPRHCDQCLDYHTAGNFIPIQDIVPIGHACVCGGRCRCRLEFRFNPNLPEVGRDTLESFIRRSSSVSEELGAQLNQ